MGRSRHVPVTYLGQIWPKINSFGSRGHQMKNYRFSRRWFFIDNFSDIRDTKIKMTPSCLACRAGSKHVPLDLERSISKFDIRTRSGHDRSGSICISFEAAWRAKSFGTICASLSPSCRDLLAKNGLWRHLTSGDLHVTLYRRLRTDLHRWGEWPWSWKIWVFSIGLCEKGSIFVFPHRLIMGRSRNWSDLPII